MTTDSLAADVSRWQWNPELREQWGGERLYFWRLAFPTYERAKIIQDLVEVMKRTGVLAYAVYELYGGYDIVLRVWLPTTHGIFESTFRQVFQRDDIVMEVFSVSEIVTHWPWAADDGKMRRLDADTVANRLPTPEIRRINAGLQLTQLAEYEDRGLLAPAWHSQGIKFIVLIGNSRHPVTGAQSARTTRDITKIILNADDEAFAERSVYKGIGFCSYLMLGRVRPKDFHRIEREITEPINELIAPETFGSRTTTFVMSTEDFLAFEDQMRVPDEIAHKRTAQEWLAEDESHHLEVKGSAFVELNAWLLEKIDAESPPRSDVPTDSLLKTITGFLNADGGTVVVGAVESDRYTDSSRLGDAPVIGAYSVWGLTPEMPERKWDNYALQLRDVLGARIRPNPNDYIDVDPDGVGKRPVAVITVRAPKRTNPAGRWFYHFPKGDGFGRFWVREGNRTTEKVGPEIDAYKYEKTQGGAN